MKKRVLSAFMALCLMLTMLPVSALAVDPSVTGDIGQDQATYSDGGLNITKTLKKQNGNLSLQLEAYVTGTVTPIETKPLDIVLVLDVSGSMGNTFTSETTYTYEPYGKYTNQWFYGGRHDSSRRSNLWVKLGDDNFAQVTLERVPGYTFEPAEGHNNSWYYYNRDDLYVLYGEEHVPVEVDLERQWEGLWRTYVYTYTFPDGSTVTSEGRDTSPSFENWQLFYKADSDSYMYTYTYEGVDGEKVVVAAGGDNDYPDFTLYYRTSDTTETTKMDAMKDAVYSFIQSVTENNDKHRIAIVKFADDSFALNQNDTPHVGNDFNNQDYNRTQVVIDFTNNKSALNSAVEKLTPAGATAADYGLELAEKVFAGTGDELAGANENSDKVIVFFTDGEPNHDNDFDNGVAEDAVDAAYSLKQAGVTIYTVGVFSGANPNDTDGRFNKYMHGVSSNYPSAKSSSGSGFSVNLGDRAEGSNYYLAADNADDLKDIFESIGGDITSSVDVDETAVLTDTLSEYFGFGDLEFDSETGTYENVSVQVAPATGDNQWGTPADAQNVTVTVKGDTISVTGFNYAENAVVNNNGTWQGSKLILTFPIQINTDADVDWKESGYYDTNSAAGLKADGGTEIGMLTESPDVYVATRRVTYEFVSGTDDRTLPEDVTSQLDDPTSEYILDTETPANAHEGETYVAVEDEGGTWEPDTTTGWLGAPQQDGSYTYTLTWTFTPDGGGTTEPTYHVGYFVIMPGMLPDNFDPSQGYDPNTYVPNRAYGDTVLYNGENHYVNDTTGYLGDITAEAARAVDGDSDHRLEITENDYENYLILPTDLGQVEEYRDDIVWYQINNRGLSPEWPNAGTATTQVNGITYHVDGYIPDVDIEVRYYANDGMMVDGYAYGRHVDHTTNSSGETLQSGDSYTILSNTAHELNFTRPGYEFTGWNTEADGTGTWYQPNNQITELRNSLVLYAQWKEVPPTVDAEKSDNNYVSGDSIDYTITIKAGEDNTGILKNFRVTDAKFPADVDDITIVVPEGNSIVANSTHLENDVLTFTLTNPLGDGTITIDYSYDYTEDESAVDENGNVTNNAIVEAWNEDDEQSGKDEDNTTTTEVTPVTTSATKRVVLENEMVPAVITVPEGVIRPTTDRVAANVGDQVTLLYAVTLTGEAGDYFNVTEQDGAVCLGAVDDDGELVPVATPLAANQHVGQIPADSTTVTLYFTMTFIVTADESGNLQPLTNSVIVNGGSTPIEETVEVVKPGLNVVKEIASVTRNGVKLTDLTNYKAEIDDEITYRITVTNDGTETLYNVKVSDSLWGTKVNIINVGYATISLETGNTYEIATGSDGFAPGASWTCTYSYTVTAKDDAAAGVVDNAATVTADNGDTSTDELNTPVLSGVSITKTANDTSVNVGDTVTYTVTVTNTGDVPLDNIVVTDDKWTSGMTIRVAVNGSTTDVSLTGNTYTHEGTLAADAVMTITYSLTLNNTGTNTNNVTVTGKLPEGATPETVTDQASEDVSVTKPSTGGGSSRPSRPTLNTKDHYSYIIGYSDGYLRPYGSITRGEVATIFFRLLTDDSREEYWSQVNDYSDCDSDLWCNNAISTLTNMGIIDGFSDGTFRPYAKITRAQFAKIAVGFFETTREDYQGYFTDVDIDAWYTEYVEAAARVGLIEGFGDGTFRPNTNITRAQACVIVNRALGRAPDEDRLLDEDEMITWPDNNPDDWFYADMQEATNSHDYTWTTVSGDKVENWTDKLPQRNWAALEHAWSTAHSAPGGEVTQ